MSRNAGLALAVGVAALRIAAPRGPAEVVLEKQPVHDFIGRGGRGRAIISDQATSAQSRIGLRRPFLDIDRQYLLGAYGLCRNDIVRLFGMHFGPGRLASVCGERYVYGG
jgi:hypothetical protein